MTQLEQDREYAARLLAIAHTELHKIDSAEERLIYLHHLLAHGIQFRRYLVAAEVTAKWAERAGAMGAADLQAEMRDAADILEKLAHGDTD